MKRTLVVIATGLLALTSLTSAALAQVKVMDRSIDPETARARWTPEALVSARPLPLPNASKRPGVMRPPLEKTTTTEEPFKLIFSNDAEEPTLPADRRAEFRQKLHRFTPEELRGLRGLDAVPTVNPDAPVPELARAKVYGSAGLDYTSSRLIPSSAVESFPYSAVGRLFFNDASGDGFVCSASVIGKRVVMTAGHCVHGGPAIGAYQDFLFVPAYIDGDAPFGAWAATNVFVLSTWTASGEPPHPHDFALLEMEDQNGERIGDVTGKLGFLANALADNHLHLLGYPLNLDDGEEMHQNISGDFIEYFDSTVLYGSDMEGGASGGPWVQNFNRKSQGQGGGQNRARAAVVGVSSFGFEAVSIRVLGASELTRDFKVLRQAACFNQAGNC